MCFLPVIITSILFGISPSLQDFILSDGVNPFALVAVFSAIASLISLFRCITTKTSLHLTRTQIFDFLIAGSVGIFLTDLLLKVSYTLIPVGYVTMIHFSFPTIVCLVNVIVFHSRFNHLKLAQILLSILGLFLLANSRFSGSFGGIITSLLTALSYSLYILMVGKSQLSKVPLIARTFYLGVFEFVPAFFISLLMKAQYPYTASHWGLCLLIGTITFIGTALYNLSIDRIGSCPTAFFNMLEPLTSLILSAIISQSALSAQAVTGCALLLLAVIFSAKNSP